MRFYDIDEYCIVLADLDDNELQASDNPIALALYAAKCALNTKPEFGGSSTNNLTITKQVVTKIVCIAVVAPQNLRSI